MYKGKLKKNLQIIFCVLVFTSVIFFLIFTFFSKEGDDLIEVNVGVGQVEDILLFRKISDKARSRGYRIAFVPSVDGLGVTYVVGRKYEKNINDISSIVVSVIEEYRIAL